MNRLQNLDAVKEQLKGYLEPYLSMHIPYQSGRKFRCINPAHNDSDPSCNVMRDNNKLFHCFGCNATGDIFAAAHFIEGRPLTGKGFVVENLRPLAQQFGVEIPELHLSEEDLYELEVKHAYQHASSILVRSKKSDAVVAKVASMEWSAETLLALGIGSVESYDTYMAQMTGQYGYSQKFLEDIDLANRAIFNPQNLIFTVCDEYGAPVGFAARRLGYEEEKARYDAIVADLKAAHQDDSGRAEILISKQVKPSKYVNTSQKNRFYDKMKRLFGLHLAKKFTPPLIVMEGYPDAATAVDRGIKNTCAIGATAFTREHVDVLLNLGIKHIVIVLDGDKAGYAGTDRAVKIIEEAVGDRVGLRVELIQMPDGSDDPDRYLRLYGVDAFMELPRYDIFSWKVRREIQAGKDPIDLAQEAVPFIVNEPNYLSRLSMIKKLANVASVDEEFLRREVARRVDHNETRMAEERNLIVQRMASDMKQRPEAVLEIVRQGVSQIEDISKRKEGYDPKRVLAACMQVFERYEQHRHDIEMATGWPIFDRVMGGLPSGAAFVSWPGKPNQGKTSSFSNLAWRVPDNNPDALVFFHTLDDSLHKAQARILGSKYSLPSKLFSKAGFYLNHPDGKNYVAEKYPDFPTIFYEAQGWLQEMIHEERLIVADINGLAGSLPALETWLRELRRKFPSRPILCMGDNFALYNLEVASDSEAVRARRKSMFVKRLANEYDADVLMTCELTKEALKPGIRPRMGHIKDTQGVAYDADCNLGVYNDLKDRGDSADLVWQDSHELVKVVGSDGIEQMAPRRKPVIELVVDKNKITDYDGQIYFEFDPASAQLRECSESEQSIYRQRAEKVTSKTLAAQIAGSHAPFKQAI